MHIPRTRTLISELDALQSARARLFLHLDLLTDMADVVTFVDTLADVATLHAQAGGSKHRRAQWRRLADVINAVHRELSLRRGCRRPQGALLGQDHTEERRQQPVMPVNHADDMAAKRY